MPRHPTAPGSNEPRKQRRPFRADQFLHSTRAWSRLQIKTLRYIVLGPYYRRHHATPPRQLLVICRARTGSNFLLTLLGSHPRIVHDWELLGEYKLRTTDLRDRVWEMGPVGVLHQQTARKGDELYAVFKVLYHHLSPQHAERWNLPPLEDLHDHLWQDRSIKVIHLKRNNILHSLVSDQVAYRNKTYILFSPNKRDLETTITLTPEECQAEFEQVLTAQQYYDDLFEHHDRLEAWYEDLVRDTEGEARHIQEWLGVPYRRLFATTVKQNVRPISEVLTNYAELRAHFAGTEWESMFDE